MSFFDKIRIYFKSKKYLKMESDMLRAENARLLEELNSTKGTLQVAQALNLDLQMAAAQNNEKLKNAESEVNRLANELDVSIHNTKYALIKRINVLGEMDMEKLRTVECSFDVYASSEIEDPYDFGDDANNEAAEDANANDASTPVKWGVVTSYCQYGGCDLLTWFDDERSARIYAILRTENGFPAGSGLCNDCRREYYESCL